MFPYYWNGQVYPEQAGDSIFRKDSGMDLLPDEVREVLELHKNEIADPKYRRRMERHLPKRQ